MWHYLFDAISELLLMLKDGSRYYSKCEVGWQLEFNLDFKDPDLMYSFWYSQTAHFGSYTTCSSFWDSVGL